SYVANPTEPRPSLRTVVASASIDPTKPEFARPHDKSQVPGIRFGWEVPDVHFDQDWFVTYEGALPNFDGLPMTVTATPKPNAAATDGGTRTVAPSECATNPTACTFDTLTLSNPNALLCRRGVEDWDMAKDRVARASAELTSRNLLQPPVP